MKNTDIKSFEAKSAWVVFSGQTDLFWLRLLKPGFRHCYILLNDTRHWISVDPLSPYTEIIVHNLSPEFDLPGWLQSRGYKAVKAPVERESKKPAPFMIFTCVEAVKRILGCHKWWILTPWQLYRFLHRQHQLKPNLNPI